MTQKTKKTTTYNIVQIIAMLIEMSWKAMSTRQTASRKNRLFVTFRNGCTLHITRKFQHLSCVVWLIISVVNLGIAFFGPAFQGFMYGSATIHKYLYQGTEAHDMLAGIIYDLNAGLKEVLIDTTWIGGLLDTLANYNFIQFGVILICTAVFFGSFAFVAWTYRQLKWHTRHQMYL